jgi:hypothetical protein
MMVDNFYVILLEFNLNISVRTDMDKRTGCKVVTFKGSQEQILGVNICLVIANCIFTKILCKCIKTSYADAVPCYGSSDMGTLHNSGHFCIGASRWGLANSTTNTGSLQV